MCENFPNIRITEGNNFSLILPLRSRTYVATKPIDEDINPTQLENIVVTFGGVEYPAQITAQGVQIDLPATLAVGTYNILLTAEYLESNIRAAYESAVTIVPWSAQSTAEQYIAGSPIVMRAAYVLSGAMTDAELEALKEEYREKNAQLEDAIAEYERRAAELDGVAQQGDNPDATNTAILEAVQQGGGTDIAKESTSQQILENVQQVINAHIVSAYQYGEFVLNFMPRNILDLVNNASNILEYTDNITTSLQRLGFVGSAKIIRFNAVTNISGSQGTLGGTYEELYLPIVAQIGRTYGSNPANVKKVYMPHVHVFTNDQDNTWTESKNLIDFTIGADFDRNISFLASWAASNGVRSDLNTLVEPGEPFANNLEKLLYNIREHIAALLPDRTGEASFSITFHANVKAAILADQATADAFTNKNWTIA